MFTHLRLLDLDSTLNSRYLMYIKHSGNSKFKYEICLAFVIDVLCHMLYVGPFKKVIAMQGTHETFTSDPPLAYSVKAQLESNTIMELAGFDS